MRKHCSVAFFLLCLYVSCQVFNVASQAAHHAAHHAQHAAAHAQAHAQAAQAAQAASAGVGRPPQSGFVPNPPRETREGGTATQECAVM